MGLQWLALFILGVAMALGVAVGIQIERTENEARTVRKHCVCDVLVEE